jgi:hypothetical protein
MKNVPDILSRGAGMKDVPCIPIAPAVWVGLLLSVCGVAVGGETAPIITTRSDVAPVKPGRVRARAPINRTGRQRAARNGVPYAWPHAGAVQSV